LNSAGHAQPCLRVTRYSHTAFVASAPTYAKPVPQNAVNTKEKQCDGVPRLAANARPRAVRSLKLGQFVGLPHGDQQD